jgi:opacity protein-like surface antigen
MKNLMIIVLLACPMLYAHQALSQTDTISTRTIKTDSVATTTTTTTITTDTVNTVTNKDKISYPPDTPLVAIPRPLPEEEAARYKVSRFYLGGRYMPVFSSFSVKGNNEGVAQTSFVAGNGWSAYMGSNFTKNFGMQLEVMYSQLSQKYTDRSLEGRIDLDYIYVPLMFVLNSDISEIANFNLTVGPQFGINTGARLTSSGTIPDSVDFIVAVKGSDFGIAYGGGIDVRLNPTISLDAGFRGMYGLLDISNNSQTKTTRQLYILDRSRVKAYAGYIGLRINF